MRIFRLFIIARVLWRFGLDEIVAGGIANPFLSRSIGYLRFGRDFTTPRAHAACARRSRRSARSSSSSARCCRRDATCCRPSSPTSSRTCRTACRRSIPSWPFARSAGRSARIPTNSSRRSIATPVASASIAQVHFATLRADAERHRARGRREGPAAQHAPGHRARPRAAADAGRTGREACPPTASACARATWSASSTSTCTTSST